MVTWLWKGYEIVLKVFVLTLNIYRNEKEMSSNFSIFDHIAMGILNSHLSIGFNSLVIFCFLSIFNMMLQ